MPSAVVNVELNGGFGRGVVQRLVKTNIKRNLYFEIKEAVVEENLTGTGVYKRKALVKRYGLNTNAEIRSRLIEILYERVNYHKDKFICPTLHEEMCGMQVKRSGKVEHSDNTHDDQVFSYLMALYVWYEGKNIMENWNIMKNTIRTDTDEEILEGDIDRDNKTETVTLDECDIIGDEDVKMQLQYLNSNKAILKVENDNIMNMMEEQQISEMMSIDKTFKQAYHDTYHDDQSTDILCNVQLPMSVFVDGDYDSDMEEEMRQQRLHGNLYNDFINMD